MCDFHEKPKKVNFVTSFVPNTVRKPYVRITTASYFSKTSASLTPCGHTISINLGDFVLQQTCVSKLSSVQLRAMLRSMLISLVVCHFFLDSPLLQRFIYRPAVLRLVARIFVSLISLIPLRSAILNILKLLSQKTVLLPLFQCHTQSKLVATSFLSATDLACLNHIFGVIDYGQAG